MRIFDFDLQDENSLIIINAIIEDKFEFRLAIDTAATHTLPLIVIFSFLPGMNLRIQYTK